MHRLSAAKACFLSDSTENTPKPDDLLQALELGQVISQGKFSFIEFSVHNWIWYRIARSIFLTTFRNDQYLFTKFKGKLHNAQERDGQEIRFCFDPH